MLNRSSIDAGKTRYARQVTGVTRRDRAAAHAAQSGRAARSPGDCRRASRATAIRPAAPIAAAAWRTLSECPLPSTLIDIERWSVLYRTLVGALRIPALSHNLGPVIPVDLARNTTVFRSKSPESALSQLLGRRTDWDKRCGALVAETAAVRMAQRYRF